MVHKFHTELAKLRASSRWPDMEEFSFQVGMSFGGYRKIETGQRIPPPETLQRILDKVGASPATVAQMTLLRDDAKASQVGIKSPLGAPRTIDVEELAKRISGEVVFVLKQSGGLVENSVRRVMEKRIVMILNSVLGV